ASAACSMPSRWRISARTIRSGKFWAIKIFEQVMRDILQKRLIWCRMKQQCALAQIKKDAAEPDIPYCREEIS
ncbi:MAG: hypothetical protein IKI81_02785, partial [Selenomonadaceae bacterium]|nr:hypothetical protein [Selenomonadaceae bacterium]